MTDAAEYLLRLPRLMKKAVDALAKQEGTSTNQFIVLALTEKLIAMQTMKFVEEHNKDNADMQAFLKILTRSGGESPRAGDER